MIHRVGEKVHKYFFYFKFIRPCIDGRILFHPHRDIILFGQDRRRLDIILHQCRNVEAFHSHHIVAEFQLVQRQKLFHHVVHLRRFIHDDITVELSALRIIIDVLLQSFRIALDQSDGSLQFMGDIRQELLTHFIDSFLFLHIPLQLIIRSLQFRNRLFQGIGQFINVLSQQIDLIVSPALIFCFKIQLYHPL